MNLIAGTALFILSTVAPKGDTAPVENRHVKFSLTPISQTVQAGGTGEIIISLKPDKGIHINLQPSIDLRLDSTAGVRESGALQLRKLDTANYLDPSKPLRQLFTVAKTQRPGTLTLRGTLTYYYCSDAEGWCSRFKQPVALTVIVKK